MKSIIVALILFSSTTTTTGFQLALTRSKIINFTRRNKTPPSTIVTVAPTNKSSISSSDGGRIRRLFFRRRNLFSSPVATPNEPVQASTSTSSVSTHRKEDDTSQVMKKIDNKRIIALVTTSCLLLSIVNRPNAAYAATITMPHFPSSLLSSTTSLIDPATLTTTTTEGLTVLNSKNNLLSKFITTALATIQMKQRSMTMFALAFGMTIVLLRCAEGGYVKMVEFVANSCLGYYGVNRDDCGSSLDESGVVKKKKSVDWNEYVLRLPRRKEGAAVHTDEDGKFVLDNKTLLFQQVLTKVARRRGDDIMMERANQSYREKQHEQHHGKDKYVASAPSSTHLDTPSHSSWDKYKTTLHTRAQTQAEHDETSEKLQILKNLVTWEDYRHLVTELQRKKEECTRLQEEVDTLTRLLEVERTVNQQYRSTLEVTPDVVVDSGGDDYEKELELKTLADKAKEYDETMQESKVKNGDSVRWH